MPCERTKALHHEGGGGLHIEGGRDGRRSDRSTRRFLTSLLSPSFFSPASSPSSLLSSTHRRSGVGNFHDQREVYLLSTKKHENHHQTSNAHRVRHADLSEGGRLLRILIPVKG